MTTKSKIKKLTIAVAINILIASNSTQAQSNSWKGQELPPKTKTTSMGDKIFVNGIPTKMVAIAAEQSIQKTSTFFYDQWSAEGWITNVQRHGEYIIVSATNKTYQKVVTLVKTGEEQSEGTISITDLPHRLSKGTGADYALAEHIPKPLNTMVINEVKTIDENGTSIITTMGNFYDVEQNLAYLRERMFELGWREKKLAKSKDKEGVILILSKANNEANFTIFRQKKQVFITVNWLSK